MRSIAQPMNLDLSVPVFLMLSRRNAVLKIQYHPRCSGSLITLIVQAARLKTHGGSGWNAENHGATKSWKTWGKLHHSFNADTGDIVGFKLTTKHVGDETARPVLIGEIDAGVDRLLADGAYDGG